MMSVDQLRFRFPRAVAAIEARIAFVAKAISFGLVGVVNTGVDFCVFWIAATELGLPLVVANVISWTVAVSGSYVMNSMFTFAAESGRKIGWRPYGTFLASGVVGLIANTTTLLIVCLERAPSRPKAVESTRRHQSVLLSGEFRGELLAVALRRVQAQSRDGGRLVVRRVGKAKRAHHRERGRQQSYVTRTPRGHG